MAYDYLQLDRDSGEPLYRQIYLSIRSAVESGRQPAGSKLPSVRRLSEDLSVSCTTVAEAYQQLCAEGYLRAQPHRGYFALSAKGDSNRKSTPPPHARRAPQVKPRYDFGTDSVDGSVVDLKAWRRNIRSALNRQEILVSYGDHQGEASLREALSAYSWRARGVAAPPECIVVGAGTQPLLSILCGLLGEDDRRIAMEEPGFRQAEQVFGDCGFSVLKLRGDGDGIDMEELRRSGVKLVFVNSSNRVKTGMCVPMQRRFELLEWAEQTGGFVVEDDYNGELRYRARPIPAMQGVENGRNVVYLGSFSKLLLPSVRIGYMALPPRLLERYRRRAANYNQTASRVEQLALSEYISSGQMERHLRRLRKLYAAKSEALVKSLRGAFGSEIRMLLQETSLTLTVSFPSRPDAQKLCRLALARDVRVQPDGRGGVRLGFAGIELEEIGGAVGSLKEAWHGAF